MNERARKWYGVGKEEWDRLPAYTLPRVLAAMDAEAYAEEQAIKRAQRQPMQQG